MHQIYEEHFEQIGEQRADRVREQLHRHPGSGEANLHRYTREAHNETVSSEIYPNAASYNQYLFHDNHWHVKVHRPIYRYPTTLGVEALHVRSM